MTWLEPTVFLVDDEPAVLRAVARVLRAAGFQTVTFDSPAHFLQHVQAPPPGCLVLDLSMPGVDGLQVQDALAQRAADLPVIFLTGRADVPSSVRAMKGGAVDVLIKPVDDGLLIEAVKRALEMGSDARRRKAASRDARTRLASLTAREREVLELVVGGLANKQVAARLGAAEKTIKVHRARVMEKMGADSLAELVRIAARAGVTFWGEHPS